MDSVERNQLQKCLDILQHSIKVTSLQGMVERLESVTRQLGYVNPRFWLELCLTVLLLSVMLSLLSCPNHFDH